MLIITRSVGESIQIGDDIRVVVNRVSDQHPRQVSLGIEAPRDIPVHRTEIYLANKKRASNS